MTAIPSKVDILYKQLAEKAFGIEQQSEANKKEEREVTLNVLKKDDYKKKGNIRSKIEVTKKQQMEFWYNIIL